MDVTDIATTGMGLAVSGIGWMLHERAQEIQRITVLLNRTREEIAKEYVTKAEVHADINRVLDRIDRLGEKMDRIMEMGNAKHL